MRQGVIAEIQRTAAMGEQIVTLLSSDEVIAVLTEAGWNEVDLAQSPASTTVVFAVALSSGEA